MEEMVSSLDCSAKICRRPLSSVLVSGVGSDWIGVLFITSLSKRLRLGFSYLFNCNRELEMMPFISAAFRGSVFVRPISVDAIMSRNGGIFGVGTKFRPLERTFFSTDVRVVELKLTTTLSNSWSPTPYSCLICAYGAQPLQAAKQFEQFSTKVTLTKDIKNGQVNRTISIMKTFGPVKKHPAFKIIVNG
ncbi:hypothetical protein M513_03301 [Trichuris suis]|uniref:Uncharacterized protein n=1 Tax=Trichuris suis TaxID=68888 RepID=A0A085MF66_9BILA|nr:hypothetical protein M513_03301 [Trichuris suis]